MNKKSFYFGTLLLTALALGSCANDDTATDKTAGKDTPKTGTVFSSETEPATRTSATYTGSGLDFYWTANDKIWVKDDNNIYHQSSEDDIANRIAAVPGSTTTAKAKFWVNGTYTGSTHKVRYTGKNGVSDKVTIKASQTQNTPNDAAHIADDGDFGVADATGSGKYSFTLNHKAAYVTFMPYTAQDAISAARLSKIRIYTDNTSDQLAGIFDLADNGSLSNGTSTSNSVEIDLTGNVWLGGFNIPNASNYNTNAAIMVIKPGTYNNVHIEYTVADPITYVEGTITKTYPSVTFTAGKNTPVKTNLQVKVYPGDGYYQWDAQQQYWAGFEWNNPNPSKRSQPTINNHGDGTDAPQSGLWTSAHTARDFNDMLGYNDHTETAPPVVSNNFETKTLNVNEAMWYVKYGDPYYDNSTLWATMGHLYKGGMWIKKLGVIAQEHGTTTQHMKEISGDGVDYRCTFNTNPILSYASTMPQAKSGIPSNLANYIYLPFLGRYELSFGSSNPGRLDAVGYFGYFWTSTPHPGNTSGAFNFTVFANGKILVNNNNDSRAEGLRLFNPDNEDEYRPF